MTRRPKVGRWFFSIHLARQDYLRFDAFTRVFEITLVKLRREPPENVAPQAGRDYAGFRFQVAYRVPFYVRSWR